MTTTSMTNRTMRVSETRNFGRELWLRDYKLAEIIDEKIYFYIDDIDSFETVDECEKAYDDVEEFAEIWQTEGATMYSDEEDSSLIDFDNNLEDEAEKCLTC